MAVLEIVMVLIGLGAVFLSFRASDNSQTPGIDEADREEIKNIPQEAKEALEKFESDIKSRAEETINKAEDKLGTLLNGKIMGLSEYSQQILDKMEQNHSETVFLYDMLNEKEKDIKELVHDADVTKADIRDELAKEYQELKKRIEEADNIRRELELVLAEAGDKMLYEKTLPGQQAGSNVQAAGSPAPDTSIADGIPDELLYGNSYNKDYGTGPGGILPDENGTPDSGGSRASMYDEEIARIEEQERREKSLRRLYGNMGISGADAAIIEAGIEHTDHSDEIISLFNKGRSVLEISKMLEIGQGEVKLVIDMYKAG